MWNVDDIKAKVAEHKIVLFAKGTKEQPMCGFSARVAQILAHLGVEYGSCNILEDFEKRACGISTPIRADLVDLVEHEDRVTSARTLYPLDDPSGERADVGAPMPTDLRLVSHSTQAHPCELTS